MKRNPDLAAVYRLAAERVETHWIDRIHYSCCTSIASAALRLKVNGQLAGDAFYRLYREQIGRSPGVFWWGEPVGKRHATARVLALLFAAHMAEDGRLP